ncbi:uncharacterized protein LOC111074234 [Drosophila obscura]|uniref:uncharacterized protein LOC111074234 n=1 Tax=Drosophila obscura TaxID=7282 RepID=UPI001BB11F9B|nr:uncharacterized protein LOC111074234 [Drosophila obscura]
MIGKARCVSCYTRLMPRRLPRWQIIRVSHTFNQMPEDLFTNMPTADVEEFFKLNPEGKQQQQQQLQASEDTRVPQVQKKTKKSICRNIFGGLSFWIGLLYVFDFLLSIHLMHPNENAFKAATEEGWLPIGWFFYFWLVLIVCAILLYDFFC